MPTDERRPGLDDVDAEACTCFLRFPHRDGLRLSLGGDGFSVPVANTVTRRSICRLVDQDPVDRRRALEPRGRVDDVARGHALTLTRLEGHECLARGDADPDLELRLLPRPVANRKRGPHRPLRIVLVRDRRPEEGHHRVADELLDGSSVALQL